MPSPSIRVMIADDHEMVRNGLAVLIEAFDDLDLVGAATNGAEALRLCDKIETDVVLMDLMMPKMDGIAATRAIRQRYPQIQVVALISFGNEYLLEEVMKAGAANYVLKSAPIDRVADAIRTAHARDGANQPDTAPRDTPLDPPNHEPHDVPSEAKKPHGVKPALTF